MSLRRRRRKRRQRPRPRPSARTRKPATAASAESANVTEVAEAPSIMAETANPITGRAIAGEALGDETPHSDFDGLKLRGVRARVVHHHPGPPCFATPATPHHRCPSTGGAGPSPGRLCSMANFAGPYVGAAVGSTVRLCSIVSAFLFDCFPSETPSGKHPGNALMNEKTRRSRQNWKSCPRARVNGSAYTG